MYHTWKCKHCGRPVPQDVHDKRPDNGEHCCLGCWNFSNHYGYYPDEKRKHPETWDEHGRLIKKD